MYNNSMTAEEKVIAFNHYVYQLVNEEHTDVIIIGVPGAIGKLNLSFPMGFGIIPFLVSQSIVPDYAIMCTFYAEFTDDMFFKVISESCKYKLGFPIDIYHMSGTYIDLQATKENGEIKYTHVPDAFVEGLLHSNYGNSSISVFNIYSESGEQALHNHLLKTLGFSFEEVKYIW